LALDAFAYIPLLATVFVAIAIFCLLSAINKKRSAKISFIAFLSIVILVCGIIYTLVHPGLMVLSMSIFCASFIFLPYCVITVLLPAKKLEKIEKKNANTIDTTVVPQTPEMNLSLNDAKKDLLDISLDFIVFSESAFSDRKEGLSRLLSHINQTLMNVSHADGGAILLIDDFEDIISVKSFAGNFPPPYRLPSDLPHKPIRVETSFKFATFPLRDNIFGEVALGGKPELITKPELDDRIYQNSPEEFLRCGSYIFIPMKIGDTVIGEFALAKKLGTPVFTQEEFDAAVTLASFGAVSIHEFSAVQEVVEHNESVKEADIACRIQQLLLQKKMPSIPFADVAVYNSLADGVCGDFYDIIVSRKDRISFTITDVVGKGMNSLMVMIMMRSMLRLIVNTKQTAGTILSWINHGISTETAIDHFASMALVNFDSTTKRINYATGGSAPIWLYSSETKDMSRISEQSEPVGVEKSTEYLDHSRQLKSGDIIVMYTDGLVESLDENGVQYSIDNLVRIVKLNHSKSAKDIISLVKNDLKQFNGNVHQHDDQTLLVVKIL
jgi:sigma-B regulation protein RsbU (phosphoserine phosphatase)